MIHWIIQENISQIDREDLEKVLKNKSMDYDKFYHIPFSDNYPPLPSHNQIFVYAASYVTDKIKNDYNEFKGVFAKSSEINIETLHLNTPQLMWNKPCFIGTMEEALKLSSDDDMQEFFVRPVLDNKVFAGQTLLQRELKQWIEKLQVQETEINPSTCKIIIAPIKIPYKEYRLYVGNGDVFASTQYRENMELFKKEGSPRDIQEYAKQFYQQNNLPYICVIDIGVSDENEIGVIEVNNINNSGFYAVDKEKWVNGIEKYTKEMLNK